MKSYFCFLYYNTKDSQQRITEQETMETTSEMDYDFVKKQMILNRLCLPKDIIENEIKSYCFHDQVSGKAIKVRKNVNILIKTALSRANGFGKNDVFADYTTHWAFGFITDDEKTQLQAENCYSCGNYLIFNNMFDTNFNHLVCECDSPGTFHEEWSDDENEYLVWNE